jgi:hypothetical protein
VTKRLIRIFVEQGLDAAIEYALRDAVPEQRKNIMLHGLLEMEDEVSRRKQQAGRDQRRAEALKRRLSAPLPDAATMRAQHEALVERMRQEQAERDAVRELAHEVIDAGRKTLAKRLHPDVGGDHEQMKRLNTAHKALKQRL